MKLKIKILKDSTIYAKNTINNVPSYNTAYTAHFVRPNFGYAETSYMLKTLYERTEIFHMGVEK